MCPWVVYDFADRLARVAAAFLADADRAAAGRLADAVPPKRPPFFAGACDDRLPTPDPDFLPPWSEAFTVAHARCFAWEGESPRLS